MRSCSMSVDDVDVVDVDIDVDVGVDVDVVCLVGVDVGVGVGVYTFPLLVPMVEFNIIKSISSQPCEPAGEWCNDLIQLNEPHKYDMPNTLYV